MTKNVSLITQYSRIKDYKNWKSGLGLQFQKAQNEQVMFLAKGGTRTIHADPHTGNTVTRSASETLEDITLFVNMMIGNSKGIASYLIQSATLPEI